MMRFSGVTLILLVLSITMLNAHAGSRVIVFGDSGVYGHGVARNETYPAQLQAMLRQKGYDVTVINAGVNGMMSSDAVADVSLIPKADVVIVHVGINDKKHGVPPGTIRKNVAWVIDKLQANGARVLVVSNPLADLCDVASSKGAACVHWGGVAPETQYVVPGDPGQHFNAAGLHLLALKILPVLEKLLVAKH